jgi:hypothetical protein
MAIINVTFFKSEIALPQLSSPAVQENVNRYINTYEPAFLNEVLGYEFATAFVDGLAEDPVLQKWTDLKDGALFIEPSTNQQTKWPGISNSIAYYVYYHLRKDDSVTTTSAGDSVSRAENASMVSSARKMTIAWNQMVKWNRIMWQYLYVNRELYGLDGSFQHIVNAANSAYSQNDFDL